MDGTGGRGASGRLMRPASGAGSSRVTYVELFFDLVFVFAVTQISHILIDQPSAPSLVHTLILSLVVWWIWIDTTWAASWLDPERGAVRALLIVLMLLGMLLAAAIPESFGSRAALFAISLVTLNLTRSIFTVFAFGRARADHAVNFLRITVWHAVPGALWIVGAFAPSDARLWIWLAALVVDYAGPRARFWTPGLGVSPLGTWDVSGAHMSERVSLFMIIALGESIVETGAGFSEQPLTHASILAFLAAFAGTVLMWLLYFGHAQRAASEYLIRAPQRGMIAQTAFTYIPALLVFGIILAAVADGLVLEPRGAPSWTAGLLCASFAVYLLGNMFFKHATGGPWLFSHVGGAAALVVVFGVYLLITSLRTGGGPHAAQTDALIVSWVANLVLAFVVVSDDVAFRRATRRTAPEPSS